VEAFIIAEFYLLDDFIELVQQHLASLRDVWYELDIELILNVFRQKQLTFSLSSIPISSTSLASMRPSSGGIRCGLRTRTRRGPTHLYPLTNYKPRKGESLARGYLAGQYGAVPFIPSSLLGKETAANGG
jgi:hypothetical protein